MEELHFIRPYWFIALLPLVILLILLLRNRHRASPWRDVVDAHLLPHQLIGADRSGSRLPLLSLGLCWLLLVAALAGPVWQRVPAVEFRPEVPPLTILLDLSRSMNARDITPSRILTARAKLRMLLERLPQRPVALTVFTLRGHSVMPFTEDRKLIQETLESLSPELMPVQGSRASAGLRFAGEQLRAFNAGSGDLLLVTDGADPAAAAVARELARDGYRVSVFGVGTPGGGKIPDERRGYLLTDAGPVSTVLGVAALQQVASQGGGYYTTVTRDDHDLLSLLESFTQRGIGSSARQRETGAQVWREGGPWLILIVLPFFLWIARPGMVPAILLLLTLPLPEPVQASEWNRLWLNQDQLGHTAFEAGDYARAESVFLDPIWRGVSQYRGGQYEKALRSFSQLESPMAHYNRGNTLVKLGRLREALQAYRETVRLSPGYDSARFNLRLLERVMAHGSAPAEPAELADQAPKKKRLGGGSKRAATSAEELLDAPTEKDRAAQPDRTLGQAETAGSAGGGALLIEGGDPAGLDESSTVGEGLSREGVPGGAHDRVAREGDGSGGVESQVEKRILPSQALAGKPDPLRQEPGTERAQQHSAPEGGSEGGGETGRGASGAGEPSPGATEAADPEQADRPVGTAGLQRMPPAGSGIEVDESRDGSQAREAEKNRRGTGGTGGESGEISEIEAVSWHGSMRNWIEAIEDNPAGLLKEKFRRDYQRAPAVVRGEVPW